MIAGALRNYLDERNELPDVPLVAMVPVTLRNDDDLEGRNLLGGALCNLGTHVEDPAERLEMRLPTRCATTRNSFGSCRVR